MSAGIRTLVLLISQRALLATEPSSLQTPEKLVVEVDSSAAIVSTFISCAALICARYLFCILTIASTQLCSHGAIEWSGSQPSAETEVFDLVACMLFNS